ncbi:hypothetical protein N7507_002334 [Penicillium longicatenatum]|nr:hypothetical protein N7507_002334 [Penicillium longicatenatum]
MTSPEYSGHFSIANIPFGVASSNNHREPQCVTRLENKVIFLGVLQRSGIFAEVSSLPEGVFDKATLNEYAALPKSIHREVRKVLQDVLTAPLPDNSTEDISAVTMHLPVSVSGFTGSTIVVSGTPVVRPNGHFFDKTAAAEKKPIIYGPSRAMDWELEIGVIVGQGVPHLQGLNAKDADENIFGFVILNDWSARDIQGCEMIPLGPLNGKAFGTSISPWVVTLDALSPFKMAGPKPEVALARHLEDVAESAYAIDMKVELLVGDQATTVSESKVQDLYWSGRQMCAHLASVGADLQTGDILGTGTVSGPDEGSLGCLLEITKAGKEPVTLSDGAKRHFLQDWDVVRMTAVAGGSTSGVGFGECVGQLRPARAL